MSIKKRVLLIVTAIVLLIGAAAAGYILTNRSEGSFNQFSENLPYKYTKSILNVDPTREFNFKISYDPYELEGVDVKLGNYSDIIEVYCEPSLTFKALDAMVANRSGKFVISPWPYGATSVFGDESLYLSKPGEWGFSDEYYIVQKYSKTGKKLEKPIVTRFTVQKNMSKPVVSFNVDEKGVGHFSWKPVENATRYYIVKMSEDGSFIRTLGSTTKTEWTTIEQDDYVQRDLADNRDVLMQNVDFQRFKYSEDQLHSKSDTILVEEQGMTKNIYGVVAVSDQDMSPASIIGGDVIEKRLPHCKATNAMIELGIKGSNIKTIDEFPTQMPITMCDGSTVLRPLIIDVDNVRIGEIIYATQEDDGTYTNRREVDICIIPYTIGGTMLQGDYYFEAFDINTYKSDAQRIVKRNIEAQVKTGQSTVHTYTTEKKDLSSVFVSRTAPQVPYEITATNPFTEYLAANMIEGNKYIDVSNYLSDENGIDVHDAATEASSQNPFILGVNYLHYYKDNKVLEVEYTVTSKEERLELQKKISDEIDRIIGSIINDGMTDEQKIKAINDYIVQNASYDYDALVELYWIYRGKYKHAWTVAGIILDKKAVCAGYAVAFKALADRAGLESVYVTGETNGEGHAWNKVKVDGAWRVIDVTWNDGPIPNKYYLLTDKQANETRTQEKQFVVDIFVDNYVAE